MRPLVNLVGEHGKDVEKQQKNGREQVGASACRRRDVDVEEEQEVDHKGRVAIRLNEIVTANGRRRYIQNNKRGVRG